MYLFTPVLRWAETRTRTQHRVSRPPPRMWESRLRRPPRGSWTSNFTVLGDCLVSVDRSPVGTFLSPRLVTWRWLAYEGVDSRLRRPPRGGWTRKGPNRRFFRTEFSGNWRRSRRILKGNRNQKSSIWSAPLLGSWGAHPVEVEPARERDFFIDNLLARIHLISGMILIDRPCATKVWTPFFR